LRIHNTYSQAIQPLDKKFLYDSVKDMRDEELAQKETNDQSNNSETSEVT